MAEELTGKSLDKNSRSDEEDARARSVKKPKGVEIMDTTMDNEMVDKGLNMGTANNPSLVAAVGSNIANKTPKGRKVVSYLDKVLCLNGDSNGTDSEEEDWIITQRREEEEEDMPDEVGLGDEEDPLCPTYVFSRKQHQADCKKWHNALIIKLMGKRMASRFLIARLVRLWNLIGTYELTDLDNGHLLVKFQEEKDYAHMLHEGPWIVADHYLIVQRWKPFFNPYNDEVKKLAVWLRILGLPTEFYTTHHLWRIGNKFGRTIKVDKTSLRRAEGVEGEITDKARFARISVEVDLWRSFVSRFRVWDFIQKEFIYLNVGYEGLHLICFACGRYGHRKDACDGGLDFAKEKGEKEQHAEAQEKGESGTRAEEGAIMDACMEEK